MHFVDSLNIHAFTKCVWALPSTGVQRYGTSNVADRDWQWALSPAVRNGIRS